MVQVAFNSAHTNSHSLSAQDFANLGVEGQEALTFEAGVPVKVSRAVADAIIGRNIPGFTDVTKLDEEEIDALAGQDTQPINTEGEPTASGAAATGVSTATAKSRASGRNG